MIKIITGANGNYLDKIKPYLETLNQFGTGEDYLCCVNCYPPSDLGRIKSVVAGYDQLIGSPEGTQSLQHGSWLQVVPGDPDDVIIWTDGDIFMQRQFNGEELHALSNWPDDTFGVSYNMGPWETLLHEALFKLHPKVSDGDFLNRWGRSETLERLCYNVGVIVAKRSAYQKLYDLYMPLWDEIGTYLAHQARQQWLISYVIGLHFNAQILNYSFHTHAHFDLPRGVLVAKDGTAYYNNDPILFWHLPMWARK